MPLSYLLYLCPRCGHDPLGGEKDQAVCSGCGIRFTRGGPGGLIRVEESSGKVWDVPGHQLTRAMEGWRSGKVGEPGAPESLIRRGKVRVRESGAEAPVWWGGKLLGFAEAMGKPAWGTLELYEDELVLRSAKALAGRKVWEGARDGPEGEGVSRRWPLLEIRAVQTSSSSLQFSPLSGGLVEFRFQNDSPFRWEALLRGALRRAYRRERLGEIVEFQPRIVAE